MNARKEINCLTELCLPKPIFNQIFFVWLVKNNIEKLS